MKKPELLAPAGDFEKLKAAIAYGADAVYMGSKGLSLRANAKNFDIDELAHAIKYAHDHNVRAYITANIFAHNSDLHGLEDYFTKLKAIGADAVIISDLGVLDIAKRVGGLELHISTQANTTNYLSAMVYKKLGAARVILARELSLDEVAEVSDKLAPHDMQTEVFIHGAMCMAYSGRCLLSNYATGRDANGGDCFQCCRWEYKLVSDNKCCTSGYKLVSDNDEIILEQDKRGTYMLNSKDLCMIEHLPQLVDSGVASLKIEGRAKSAYYVATAVNAYRMAIDDLFNNKDLYQAKKADYLKELKKTQHRDFTTGFYFDKAVHAQNVTGAINKGSHEFAGVVLDYDHDKKMALIEQRNKFSIGDTVEFIKGGFSQEITQMQDANNNPITTAPHPQQLVYISTAAPLSKLDMMRRVYPA